MSKTNLHETRYLELVFQNLNHSNIGDTTGLRGSNIPGSFYIALFTAITDGEVPTVTEANYTDYDRVTVVRSAVGFTVVGNLCSNAAAVVFPENTGSLNTIVGFGIYTADKVTGGDLIGYGTLTPSVVVNPGDTPQFIIGQLIITEY